MISKNLLHISSPQISWEFAKDIKNCWLCHHPWKLYQCFIDNYAFPQLSPVFPSLNKIGNVGKKDFTGKNKMTLMGIEPRTSCIAFKDLLSPLTHHRKNPVAWRSYHLPSPCSLLPWIWLQSRTLACPRWKSPHRLQLKFHLPMIASNGVGWGDDKESYDSKRGFCNFLVVKNCNIPVSSTALSVLVTSWNNVNRFSANKIFREKFIMSFYYRYNITLKQSLKDLHHMSKK